MLKIKMTEEIEFYYDGDVCDAVNFAESQSLEQIKTLSDKDFYKKNCSYEILSETDSSECGFYITEKDGITKIITGGRK